MRPVGPSSLSVNRWLKSMRDAMVGLAFPHMCALCASIIESLDDGVACESCWREMPPLVWESRCERCGVPQQGGRKGAEVSSCAQCRAAVFTSFRFLGRYEGALRANILFLKRQPHLCERIKGMIKDVIQREVVLHTTTRVLPVPLHPSRRKERGFNQAELIGSVVASAARVPFDRRTLVRIRLTDRHRAGMDATARAKSLSSAFSITRPDDVRDQSILLVDDVFTTGATLNECVRALFQAGAQSVYGFTLARVLEGSWPPDRTGAISTARTSIKVSLSNS